MVPAGHPGKRKDSGCKRSLPPHHLGVPRFPNFPLDGGLVLRDRFLLPSPGPHPSVGCSSAWASSNPASQNSPGKPMYWGHQLPPHPRTVTSAQRPLPQATPCAALWPGAQECLLLEGASATAAWSTAPLPQIHPQPAGLPVSGVIVAPPPATLSFFPTSRGGRRPPFLPLAPQVPEAGPAPVPGCQVSASRPLWNLGTSNKVGQNWAEPVRRRGLGWTQGRSPSHG